MRTAKRKKRAGETPALRRAPSPCILALLFAAVQLLAAEHHGTVTFGGLPVPGVTVTATQGDQTFATTTDQQGAYTFGNLRDGTWTIRVEMQGFVSQTQQISVAAGTAATAWELKMLPLDELLKQAAASPAAEQNEKSRRDAGATSSAGATATQAPPEIQSTAPAPTPQPAAPPPSGKATTAKGNKAAQQTASAAPASANFPRTEVNAAPAAPASSSSAAAEAIPGNSDSSNQDELREKAENGFLVNGSAVNGAASPFAQNAAFGNNRRGLGSLYNGGLFFNFDNSALDARSYSLTGLDTPKPSYSHFQGGFTLGGPLRIPHLLTNGPFFSLSYQWTHNRNATTQSGLVPTLDQREGNGAGETPVSPQAVALLNLYPVPNVNGVGYNYQTALVGATHQDALQTRMQKMLDNRNQLWGQFAFQRTASDSTSLLGFLDKVDSLGFNLETDWQHRFGQRTFVHLQFQYSRQATRTIPFFANRIDVSGNAGIAGNSQAPADWGPPTLIFSSGVTSLTDVQSSFDRNQTAAWTYYSFLNRGRHNWSYGVTYRRQDFNYSGQQDARGTFTFTGALTGSDFGDFLAGVPTTSSIAFGNADKYFRENVWDAFVTDDWRIGPSLTVNLGVRWEYAAPITERYGRLVNLDIAPGFSAIAPVAAINPSGPLTGQQYPDSLLRPDRHGFEPRVGLAWRPFPASSMVIRAGYGVYYNTSVYQQIANQMAQQSPFSKNLSVQNSASNPLTLANGFVSSSPVPNTFAVDPNFQVGYSQNWQASIQRDLPGSLVFSATYAGIKGTRGMQEFLPNTYPPGAPNPCPTCPVGFTYLASNGNSTRESGQVQLRRRLHNGFTATLQYTYSKSIDDSALGGRNTATSVIAQNWLDLAAERGLSLFDQRHLLNLTGQYTTGMGLGGGTLLNGWRGALFKEWTASSTIAAGSGFPLTPQYLAEPVPGTGITSSIRPNYTGAPLYAAPAGRFLNPAAYAPPVSGEWGNAGRDSISGPFQFSLNASLARTFRLKDRYSLDLRVDSTNALNHVTYTGWNTLITSPQQFGLASGAAAMRSLQTTVRVRF